MYISYQDTYIMHDISYLKLNLICFLFLFYIYVGSCADFFCSEHFSYKGHGCSSGRTDYKAPICPACQQVVPNPPDSSPDQAVSRHLDQFCPNEREKAKIFKNGCAYRNCKRKELVPIKCHLCQLNFCLKHRHNLDHDCEGERVGRQRQALA